MENIKSTEGYKQLLVLLQGAKNKKDIENIFNTFDSDFLELCKKETEIQKILNIKNKGSKMKNQTYINVNNEMVILISNSNNVVTYNGVSKDDTEIKELPSVSFFTTYKKCNIKLSDTVEKNISNEDYYTRENFIKDVKCYIKALKAGRLQYKVTHVSKSGMSRNINIQSYEGNMNKGYFRSYYDMLNVLNYNFADKYSNDIKVNGCGMDMLFSTNYNLIHSFKNMGFITKKSCDTLAQKI